jgi:hypothetical protein
MKLRPSPALAVAVLALVVSLAGTSYAAVQVTSAQIKNSTIKGKDIKDRTITGKDVRDSSLSGADIADGSLAQADLSSACPAGQLRLVHVCLVKATRAKVPLTDAVKDCADLGGRLPTYDELVALSRLNPASQGVTWVDNMPNMYEYSGTIGVEAGALTSVASDEGGNLLAYSNVIPLGHHCVIP